MELKIGDLQKLRSRRIQCISLGERRIVLIYHQLKFYALDNACPHKLASLCEGYLRDDRLVCPWHGAEFNIASGESFSPLASKGTNSYSIFVRNQSVFIDFRDVENQ